jgi:hypothetical protein
MSIGVTKRLGDYAPTPADFRWPVVYLGQRSYRAIGIAWLLPAAWDLPHQLAGRPIWPHLQTSSLGCMIFDTVIAAWFLAVSQPSFHKDGPELLSEAHASAREPDSRN